MRVVFTLTEPSGVCERTYDVSGPGLLSDDLMAGEHVTTSFTRNASHLRFSVSGHTPLSSSIAVHIVLIVMHF